MTRRPSPLEQMRALADDGMEPWQIAAALGVRESAVLVALGDTTAPGGAQRAVEDAVSVVPTGTSAQVEIHKPDASGSVEEPDRAPIEAAPRYGTTESAARGQQGVQVLRDRIRALGITPAQLRDWAATHGVPCPANGQVPGRVVDAWEAAHAVRLDDVITPPAEVEFDPGDASTYPCAIGRDCGCSDSGLRTCPGHDQDLVAEARRARDEPGLVEAALLAGAPWPLALEAAATVALDRDPDYGTHVVEGPVKVQQPDGTWADVTVAEDGQSASYTVTQAGEHVLHMPDAPPLHANPFVLPAEPEHVHDPFVAWRPDGVPYATCTCGETWERQTCTECPAIVAALWVAQHGPTHKHCAAKKTTAERTNP